MDDPTHLLQELGFSEYEARAYIALLRKSPLNGYELAKVSGIPRPNIYAVLQKLQGRQAVTPIETASGVHYVPLPPETLTQRMSLGYQELLAQAAESLKAVTAPEDNEVLWNLRGYETILQKAQALIDAAESSVLLGVWQPESEALADATRSAEARGLEFISLCIQACPDECGFCHHPLFRYHMAPSNAQRWLIVVRDEAELLFASLAQDEPTAMHSRQASLVQLAGWYVRNSVALAAILSDTGSSLENSLNADTLDVLKLLVPGNGVNWLDYMLALVNGSPGGM